jgi:DNA polymerase-4
LVRARTVVVKLRESDFTTHTHRLTVREPVDTAERMFPIAWKLAGELLRPGVPIRLVGVYGTQFEGAAAAQLSLFDGGSARNRRLSTALDDISRRFGDRAITRAALVREKGRQGSED